MWTYFKMKQREWKLKLALYNTIQSFLDTSGELIAALKNINDSLQGLNGEELQEKFVDAASRVIMERDRHES